MIEIDFSSKLNEKEEAFIEKEHKEYELKNGVNFNYTPFHYIAKEEENIVGIVSGYTCYEEVYIDGLVVNMECRNKGIGRELINTVENKFSNKGFNNINLVTNAFQAPNFYEKCGFELEFIRKNKENPKLDKYFYVKYFNN